MEYCMHSHRDALTILENDPAFAGCWQEIRGAIESISDDMIIENYEGLFRARNKSLSTTINHLLEQEFLSRS